MPFAGLRPQPDVLTQSRLVNGQRMATLPTESPEQRDLVPTAAQGLARVARRITPSTWRALSTLWRARTALESISISLVAQLSASMPGNTRKPEALRNDGALDGRLLLDPAAFAAICSRHAATRGRFGWVARPAGRQTGSAYYLQEAASLTAKGMAGRTYGLAELPCVVYASPRPSTAADCGEKKLVRS